MEIIIEHLTNVIGEKIIKITPISGGDISKAFKVETANEVFFLKTNTSFMTDNIFQSEAFSLSLIENTNTLATPKVIDLGTVENSSYILLEYIDPKIPTKKELHYFGQQLALLHTTKNATFGLPSNNFIGSLSQSNIPNKNWVEFYVDQRLQPQLRLAFKNNYLPESYIPSKEKMQDVLFSLLEDIEPSLIHGDLWSGNFLFSQEGIPYLIDPCCYFGHSEVDIAMTKLFGGFGKAFYKGYGKYTEVDHKASKRIEIYQLYYLLVHLNLFGISYLGSVKDIIAKRFLNC